jgi:hypothetical protein
MSPLGLRKRLFAKKSTAGSGKAIQKPAPLKSWRHPNKSILCLLKRKPRCADRNTSLQNACHARSADVPARLEKTTVSSNCTTLQLPRVAMLSEHAFTPSTKKVPDFKKALLRFTASQEIGKQLGSTKLIESFG